ncbi:MAG: LPS export ABC transporter permease LptG [Gammaproteobacteria bacterium]
MRILDRYIGRAVLQGAVLVWLVLVALLTVIDFVVEMADIGTGSYGLLQALEYVLLTLPRRAHEMLPMAALIGSLVGLGALANSSELVVMRASGVSLLRIALSVLRVGGLLIVVALVLGEGISPPAEQWAQERRTAALAEAFSNKTKLGFWVRDGDSYINIRRILPGARLSEVTIYRFGEDETLRSTLHAKSAVFDQGAWRLQQVRLSQLSEQRVRTARHDEVVWETQLDPELVNVVSVEPERLSTLGLYQYVTYLQDNELESQRYEIAFWIKLLSPLATVLMLILALPFVFGSLRSVAISQRVLLGTFLGIGFQILSRSFGHIGQVYDLPPLFAAALPLVLFSLLAIHLFRRVT